MSADRGSSDWAKVAALSDAEIDTTDIPSLDDAFFAQATMRMPNRPLAEVTLHIDPLLLRWFQNQGAAYERLINAALRIYVEAHSSYEPAPGKGA
jgi:uncharacterized protein (DUF4415 family)